MAWSKDDKQQLAGTGGRVNGHARNRENRRQQYHKNRSAHVATIAALQQNLLLTMVQMLYLIELFILAQTVEFI